MKRTVLCGALLAACLGSVMAQETPPAVAQQQKQELRHGDPARWFKADTSQKQEMATLRKEIHAALQEALQACKEGDASARRDCVREARATYQEDIANIRDIHMASKELSKTYETSGQ